MRSSSMRRWTVAKQDAERVRKEFVDSLPFSCPAYDADWTTRYGSRDRLIFVFAVVLDLDNDADTRDYPYEAARKRERRSVGGAWSAPRSMSGVSTWSRLPDGPG